MFDIIEKVLEEIKEHADHCIKEFTPEMQQKRNQTEIADLEEKEAELLRSEQELAKVHIHLLLFVFSLFFFFSTIHLSSVNRNYQLFV